MYEGQLRNVNSAWQENTDASEFKWEFRSLFIFDTVILGFLTI